MTISPFNPLFFLGTMKRSGIECPFMQLFSVSDEIVLEVIRESSEEAPDVTVHGFSGGVVALPESESHMINGGTYVDCHYIRNLPTGEYYVRIGDSESEPFRITADERMLGRTVLIEYSPYSNNVRGDVVAVAGGKRIFFGFRIPGGFKDDGWIFSIDNEQFVTPMSDIVELYGRESVQKTLTMGFSCGVPVWYGQLLNRILTCRYVHIDGVRHARYESSVPEKTQTLDGVNSFVFTQKLQEIHHLYSPYNSQS